MGVIKRLRNLQKYCRVEELKVCRAVTKAFDIAKKLFGDVVTGT